VPASAHKFAELNRERSAPRDLLPVTSDEVAAMEHEDQFPHSGLAAAIG
jgi:hypothetical protein